MNRTLLHVGRGPLNKSNLKGFQSDQWSELRLDIGPTVRPDIIGTLVDMQGVASASVDAVFSSHNLEHLYPHEVVPALKEFRRVLRDDGFVVLTCPDLQSVCEAVVRQGLMAPLYVSPAGPISAIDILYGLRPALAQGNTFMAHRSGFTYASLTDAFGQAGFARAVGGARPQSFDLWILASKQALNQEAMKTLADEFFP